MPHNAFYKMALISSHMGNCHRFLFSHINLDRVCCHKLVNLLITKICSRDFSNLASSSAIKILIVVPSVCFFHYSIIQLRKAKDFPLFFENIFDIQNRQRRTPAPTRLSLIPAFFPYLNFLHDCMVSLFVQTVEIQH